MKPGTLSILIVAALLIAGLALIVLGVEGTFTFIGCGPGAISCVRVYSLDLLSIFVGAIATLVGAVMLIRRAMCSPSSK